MYFFSNFLSFSLHNWTIDCSATITKLDLGYMDAWGWYIKNLKISYSRSRLLDPPCPLSLSSYIHRLADVHGESLGSYKKVCVCEGAFLCIRAPRESSIPSLCSSASSQFLPKSLSFRSMAISIFLLHQIPMWALQSADRFPDCQSCSSPYKLHDLEWFDTSVMVYLDHQLDLESHRTQTFQLA